MANRLSGREGLDRESVDPISQKSSQRVVDEAVTRDAALSRKARGD